MSVLLFAIGFLCFWAFPVAALAVLYPFRPFRTRRRALKAVLASFLGFAASAFVAGALEDDFSERAEAPRPSTREAAAEASSRSGPATVELAAASPDPVERSGESVEPVVDEGSGPDGSADTPAPASDATEAQECAAMESGSTGSEASPEPGGPKEAERPAPRRMSARKKDEILRAIDVLDFIRAGVLLRTQKRRDLDLAEDLEELEAVVLRKVRPLPARMAELNRDGYALLVEIDPDEPLYARKARQYAEAVEANRTAAIRRMRPTTDKIEGITWYEHPDQPRYLNSRSTVSLYIGRRGDGPPFLRMISVYAAKDWLFVDRVLAHHDGVTETLVSGAFEREVSARSAEWRDDRPSGLQIEILRSLGEAREAILRFEGRNFWRDVTLRSRDKRALLEVLEAYEAMKDGG